MAIQRVIVIDPDIMNGIPCFRGTRVPFKNLIDYLEGGYSLGEFLNQFPTVTREMANCRGLLSAPATKSCSGLTRVSRNSHLRTGTCL